MSGGGGVEGGECSCESEGEGKKSKMRGSVTESTMSMSGGKGSVSSDLQVLVAD